MKRALMGLVLFLLGFAAGRLIGSRGDPTIVASARPTETASIPAAPSGESARLPVCSPAESARAEARHEPPVEGPHAEMPPEPARPVRPLARRELLDRLEDPREIDRFLAGARLDNFFDAIRSARPFARMDESLAQLNGRFQGEVRFAADASKAWEMTLEARLRIEERNLKGSTVILLAEKGKVFSRLTGNGDLKEYQSLGDGLGILVKASPDAYFQLYYLSGEDAFVGNYYHQESVDKVVPQGTVRLDRG